MRSTLLAMVLQLVIVASAHGQVLFGSTNDGPSSPSYLYRIDPTTGAGTLIGPIGFNVAGAMDFHPVTGVLYATGKRDLVPVLITIDIASGAGTEVGPLNTIPTPSSCFAGGLLDASFRSDGALFATTIVDDPNNPCLVNNCFLPQAVGLATIDTSTGGATVIGSSGTCSQGNGLSFSLTDTLYQAIPFSVYEVDPLSGAIAAPVSTSVAINGMDAHPITGDLYLSIRDDMVSRSLGVFDPITGATTVIGSSVDKLDGIAWSVPTPATPGIMYASTGVADGGRLLTIDLNTGAGTLVGATGLIAVPEIEIDSNGKIFAVEVAAPSFLSDLYRLDAASGTAYFVANIGLVGVEGLAFDENGVLYGASQLDSGFMIDPFLWRIDTVTGVPTLVGPTVQDVVGMAFDPTDGTLYATRGRGVDEFYTIDPNTGSGTFIGSTGLGGSTPSIAFDAAGNLYGVKGGGLGTNKLISIDKSTGAGTEIGLIGFSSVSGLAFHPPACCTPALSCPADVSLQCGDSTGPSNTGTAVVTNGCPANVTFSDAGGPVNCTGMAQVIRTWTATATDACGLSTSCVQLITFVDATAPVITCPADLSVDCSLELLAIVSYPAPTVFDNCDSQPTVTCTPTSGSASFAVGENTVTCTAVDCSGNESTCSFTVTRAALGFTGFLAPINGEVANGTGGSFSDPARAFKFGSTIPVKFRANCGGSPVATGVHTLQATKYSSSVDSDLAIDATPTDAVTTGNQFRLTSAASGEWHFNLNTKPLSMGTWKLTATLSDGTTHEVWISIKR